MRDSQWAYRLPSAPSSSSSAPLSVLQLKCSLTCASTLVVLMYCTWVFFSPSTADDEPKMSPSRLESSNSEVGMASPKLFPPGKKLKRVGSNACNSTERKSARTMTGTYRYPEYWLQHSFSFISPQIGSPLRVIWLAAVRVIGHICVQLGPFLTN